MVCKYGMSESIGKVSLNYEGSGSETRAAVDAEVHPSCDLVPLFAALRTSSDSSGLADGPDNMPAATARMVRWAGKLAAATIISGIRRAAGVMRHAVKAQVRKLVNAAYERARGILMNNRDELEALASELLDKESLTGAQVQPPCKLSVDKQKQAGHPRQQLEFLGTSDCESGAVGIGSCFAQCHLLCAGHLACTTTRPVSM